jgi:hypothetical protein
MDTIKNILNNRITNEYIQLDLSNLDINDTFIFKLFNNKTINFKNIKSINLINNPNLTYKSIEYIRDYAPNEIGYWKTHDFYELSIILYIDIYTDIKLPLDFNPKSNWNKYKIYYKDMELHSNTRIVLIK